MSKALILSLLLGLFACSNSSVVVEGVPDAMGDSAVDAGPREVDAGEAGDDAGPPPVDAGPPPFDAGSDAGPLTPPPATPMASCLEAGGSLSIAATIDNNDTREHGPILAFDVSPERQIVVSTEDATLKFWTLDSFAGETGLAQLSYGPEIIATSVALDFWEELAVAGDSQGVIAGWSPEFGMQMVLGGTAPGTALVALAIDDENGFLAQADAEGTLLVRPLPGFEGETTQLEGIDAADLAWAGGVLFVATPRGLEARDTDLTLIAEAATDNPQLHVQAEGGVVLVGDTRLIQAFDTSLQPLSNDILSFAELEGLTLMGGHPVGLFGGEAPYIEVQIELGPGEQRNTTFNFELRAGVPRVPVQVVADPQGELLFVAFEDGGIELLRCEN